MIFIMFYKNQKNNLVKEYLCEKRHKKDKGICKTELAISNFGRSIVDHKRRDY